MNNECKISPERQKAFLEFVYSLPRTCSPSLFKPKQYSNEFNDSLYCKKSDSLFTENNDQFNWSVDEYALVYGQDFNNENEIEHFHSIFNSSEESKELDWENEKYFSQETILPSPQNNELTRLDQSISTNKQYVSRNTGSFLESLSNMINYNQLNDSLFELKINNDSKADEMITNDSIEVPNHIDSINGESNLRKMSINEQSLSIMDYSVTDTPNFPKIRCNFDNGQIIDTFLDDISPIVSNRKGKLVNENNKDNCYNSPTNCQSDRLEKVKWTPNFGLSVMNTNNYSNDVSMIDECDNNNHSEAIIKPQQAINAFEFVTPRSAKRRRYFGESRTFKAKLLFSNDFASTPNINKDFETPSTSNYDNKEEHINIDHSL